MASQSSALMASDDDNSDLEMREVSSQALSLSHASSMPLPSSRASSLPPQSNELPNYSLWTVQKYALWPGFTTFHDSVAEKNPWWQFGYRMKDERTSPKKIFWICYQCFKRGRPLTRDYTYNASTWKSIERHMKKAHRTTVS